MEDIVEFAIKELEKNKVTYAEVRYVHSIGSGVIIKNQIPQVGSFEETEGIGIRYILNNALGFLSINELNKEKIKDLIKKNINKVNSNKKINDNINLASDKSYKDNYEVKQKIKLADIDFSEKIKLLVDAEKDIRNLGIKIAGTYLALGDVVNTQYFVNTEGTKIKSIIPRISFWYQIGIIEKDQIVQRYWPWGASGGFEIVKNWDIPKILIDEVKTMSNNLKNGIKPPKEEVDLVVAPQVTGIMCHESVGHPYEADRILGREAAQAGESFVTKELLNTKIGSNEVTVIDDPTIENSFGFYKYDDEGIKAKKRILIKNGIINELLQNRETAYTFNIKSNGSARATDYDKEPLIRMGNTILEKGSYKEEELFEGIKKGVYIKNFMEWNIDDKRFNQKYVGADAYLIENGKITKPVIKPIIEITTPKLWGSVDAVANNTEYHAGNCGKGEPMQACPVWFGGPSMRIRNIKLG